MRDANEKLQKKGVKIYGVSFDTVDAQNTFVEKQKLPFDLLADIDGTVIKAFGVPHRGKFASRQAYLFKDGKLVWKDEANGHVDWPKPAGSVTCRPARRS